jgi:RNA polymerase sigma factor (TIGR02999 family)
VPSGIVGRVVAGGDAPGTEVLSQLLRAAGAGDAGASEQIVPLVYQELRRLAHARIARLAPGQTLQTTELVHEVWLRLAAGGEHGWESKAHFFGAAANAIRNILVDQARRRGSQKRDASRKREIDTDLPELAADPAIVDVLSVHEALQSLEAEHPRPARVTELKFFAALSMPEIADVLGLSLATVERDWKFAKAWLQDAMSDEGA